MNRIIIKGRLTADPELKYTEVNNAAYVHFSVAVDRKFKQEGQPTADFFNLTAWNKTAEFIGNYFKKGQEILVEGRLQNRSWQTETGENRYATDIIVESVEFCGSKKDNSEENTVESIPDNSSIDSDLPF